MATWMRITTKKDSWPKKTRIVVLLREDAYEGRRLSGDVTIVIRKNNDPSTTTKLGLSDTDLVAHVTNGRWESPEWDYSYWAGKGFNTLVAMYQGHEWFWSSEAVASAAPAASSRVVLETRISPAPANAMMRAVSCTASAWRRSPIFLKVGAPNSKASRTVRAMSAPKRSEEHFSSMRVADEGSP